MPPLRRMNVIDFSPFFAFDEVRQTLICQVESTRRHPLQKQRDEGVPVIEPSPSSHLGEAT